MYWRDMLYAVKALRNTWRKIDRCIIKHCGQPLPLVDGGTMGSESMLRGNQKRLQGAADAAIGAQFQMTIEAFTSLLRKKDHIGEISIWIPIKEKYAHDSDNRKADDERYGKVEWCSHQEQRHLVQCQYWHRVRYTQTLSHLWCNDQFVSSSFSTE